MKRWLSSLSFRTGATVLAFCIIFYILSFAQMLLPIGVAAKGVLWTVLFGLAKTCQYAGLAILGAEGVKSLKKMFSKKKNQDMQRKTVEVAAAIIRDGNKILATQRGYGEFKDFWEFPGGKIEKGETAEEALIREVSEELDMNVNIESFLATVEYDYPSFHLKMQCFMCTPGSGGMKLKEHESAKWLHTENLQSVRWLPADLQLMPVIEKTIRRL